MSYRVFVISVLWLCAWLVGLAAPPADLTARIDQFITTMRDAPGCAQARVGIVVQSLDDNTRWYAKSANTPFIPASVAKLVTASLALQYLGPEYRFTTRLLTDGEIREGVVHGNMIVQGGGDPLLQPEALAQLAHALTNREVPITRITGKLLLDDSAFPRPGPQWGPGWEKDDLLWYYAAPASALSCNRNALKISVRGTTPGQPAEIDLTPTTAFYSVQNQVATCADVTTGAIEVTCTHNEIVVSGQVAPGATLTERISIRDPQQFLREQLMLAFSKEGIALEEMPYPASSSSTVVAEHQSLPLSDVLHAMLKDSDNHIAEQLRWTLLARAQTTTPLRVRYEKIQKAFCQQMRLPAGSVKLVDGSGLSRWNRLTPMAVATLLRKMASSPHAQAYAHGLPVAGVDGTLQKRMVGTPAAGKVQAKTGTMRGVCTLAGYVTTKRGERLALVVMVNGYSSGAKEARALQDSIAAYLAGL